MTPASKDGSTYRFKIERMLPYMPMVIDGHQVLLPEIERAECDAGRISAAYARIVERCKAMPLPAGTYEATLRF